MTAFSSDVARMHADIEDYFGETVTLRKNARTGFNTTTGVQTSTQTTQSVPAVRREREMATRTVGNGRASKERTVFEILVSSVTLGAPERGWGVTDAGGRIYQVVEHRLNPTRTKYILTCEAGV